MVGEALVPRYQEKVAIDMPTPKCTILESPQCPLHLIMNSTATNCSIQSCSISRWKRVCTVHYYIFLIRIWDVCDKA